MIELARSNMISTKSAVQPDTYGGGVFADSTSKYGSTPDGAKSCLKAKKWNRGDPQGMERELA